MNSVHLSNSEYAPFYSDYIKALGEVDLRKVLKSSLKDLNKTIKNLPEEKLLFKYAEGKWTIKELLQHIIDTERILSYRALRFSRNDASDLPGFDENWYVANSNGNERSITDLLDEFKFVRKSTLALFKSFTSEMFTKTGTANGSDMTVRALGFIIAGHQTHHLNIIKERYL
ncbi:DinB superfamily protein [Lutibacter oricola]|uniref:DinB superfamily protein n=1 Tax=Lutibacter oricola TaxID=762486 RepID=A0A1H3EFD6_9FLAO|nr:DinB family protein [Lutibacter oricola]SDX77453.1 DinB superfamily protein [Lutibacter oricola]